MVDRPRARKMAVRIRQVVAETLERQVKDPRLALVTVTDARLTPDLREASVYFTVYGDEAAWTESSAALASATGVVRAAVGRALGVRYTPSIIFLPDGIPGDARRVEALLETARAADAQVAEVRAGKSPAGEPDPYRHGDEAADDTSGEAPGGTQDVTPGGTRDETRDGVPGGSRAGSGPDD